MNDFNLRSISVWLSLSLYICNKVNITHFCVDLLDKFDFHSAKESLINLVFSGDVCSELIDFVTFYSFADV